MPPQYVRPYVKRNKNDAANAEAICEAVTRPQMRFVAIKSAEQQSVLMLHRARELLIRQRTMLVNAMRGHCGELGITVAQGVRNVASLLSVVCEADEQQVPTIARRVLTCLSEQLCTLQSSIADLEREIVAWHRQNKASSRLQTIPGVGPITASAIAATVTDAGQFRSGREFAAWIGLVPRQHSSGGKERLGAISKRGDAYLRRLLIHGARTVVRWQLSRKKGTSEWLQGLLIRRNINVAVVALANKNARIAWAILSHGDSYRARQPAA
jgi:transposase